MKVQQNLLKATDARDGLKKKKYFNIPYFITEDKVWVCPDEVWMMGIPKDIFYLDKEKIWKDTKPIHGEKFIKQSCDLELATDTHIIMDVEQGNKKMKLHKFKVNEEEVFVNENILNYFEPDATFRGKKRNSPLYVYELGKLVGVICPVIYKEYKWEKGEKKWSKDI